MPLLRKSLVLIGGCAGLAGIGSYYLNSTKTQVSATDLGLIAPSRTIRTGLDKTGLKLTLYQYQSCPFCCKVRAYLNFRGLDYDVVEVNPITRQQIKFSQYKKVPIVLINSESGEKLQLNDSSMIVSSLQSFLVDQNKKFEEVVDCYPAVTNEVGEKTGEIMNIYNTMYGSNYKVSDDEVKHEVKWREWADKEFVHVLSPNVYRTPKESLQTFNKFSEVGNWEEHFSNIERYGAIYIGAAMMFLVGKRLKKKHALKDDVRQSLYDSCSQWTRGLQGKFNGGEKPNLADLAIYGMLSSIEGTETFHDMLENTKIGSWYSQMKTQVENHAGAHILKK